MEEKITFEDYGIEFDDSDFEDVSKETLEECKKQLLETMKEFEKKEGDK